MKKIENYTTKFPAKAYDLTVFCISINLNGHFIYKISRSFRIYKNNTIECKMYNMIISTNSQDINIIPDINQNCTFLRNVYKFDKVNSLIQLNI